MTSHINQRGKWPKVFEPLTAEQQSISDDFMRQWHEVLPNRYGLIEKFNHRYPSHSMTYFKNRPEKIRTLEIGAGLGAHIAFEDLSRQDYCAIEILPNMIEILQERYPSVTAIQGDIEQQMDYPSSYFDRIIAVHVLEHLWNLPAALQEIDRLLAPDGVLSLVLPCEGGVSYALARQISAKRLFERTYKQSYRLFVERIHVSTFQEIRDELLKRFHLIHERRFPLRGFPITFNLVVGLTLVNLHNRRVSR